MFRIAWTVGLAALIGVSAWLVGWSGRGLVELRRRFAQQEEISALRAREAARIERDDRRLEIDRAYVARVFHLISTGEDLEAPSPATPLDRAN